MSLEIKAVHKSYDAHHVLRGISFHAAAGEVVVLLGPSGCGKTTLLRIIAGLEKADRGFVSWKGQDLTAVPVHQRSIGMVFQDFALFPHKSVGSNIEFGLRMQEWPDCDRDKRVKEMLELVGLEGYSLRRVFDLSGGERQRVALARSLAPSPRLLLLDEPLSSLDRSLRERLMIELREILKQAGEVTGHPEGITSIYVTHDQEEAFALADRVIVIGRGGVEQIGTPEHLYNHPENSYVARFLGMKNLLPARLVSDNPTVAKTAIGDLVMASTKRRLEEPFTLLIRPNAASFDEDASNYQSMIRGRITNRSFRGRHSVVEILVVGEEQEVPLVLEFPSTVSLPTDNSEISLYLIADRLILLE